MDAWLGDLRTVLIEMLAGVALGTLAFDFLRSLRTVRL